MAASSSHRLALPAGFMLEEYRILSVLGQGGFGITYLAQDTKLDAKVAIKEMLPKDFATRIAGVSVAPMDAGHEQGFAWAKTRFIEEARHLAKLNHPNIIRVFRFIEANGTAYLVMEFVQGQTLMSWMQAHRRPSEQELKTLLFPILDGLEHVHQHQLLHRDISPENILITDHGRPLLLDFGSARESLVTDQTLSGVIRPGFSPIEQYQSKAAQGPFTDIYALAAVMIRALTNTSPPISMDRTGPQDPYVSVAQCYRGKYSDSFLRALDAGFAFMAKDRPQTVVEWRSQLRRPDPSKAKQIPQSCPEPKRSHRLAWIVALLALAAIGAGAWFYFSPPVEPKDDKNDLKKKELEYLRLHPDKESGPRIQKVEKEGATVVTIEKKTGNPPLDQLTNSLGMEFVKVPGVDVMFCVHQTRMCDYEAFTHGGPRAGELDHAWKKAAWNGAAVGPGGNDPVVEINWHEAEAFCAWLSEKEKRHYRLPLSSEWASAAGKGKYPWGDQWPPNDSSKHPLGNFADQAARNTFGQNVETIPDYTDSFPTTSPVKSFPANVAGLYDLGSNVREWCEDSAASGLGFTCGASWRDSKSDFIALHGPVEWGKEIRSPIVGFRCVLDLGFNEK